MGWLCSQFTAVVLCEIRDMVTAKTPENVKSRYLIFNFTDISDVAKS